MKDMHELGSRWPGGRRIEGTAVVCGWQASGQYLEFESAIELTRRLFEQHRRPLDCSGLR